MNIIKDIAAGLGLLLFACVGAAVFIAAIALAVKFLAFGIALLVLLVLVIAWALGRINRAEREGRS